MGNFWSFDSSIVCRGASKFLRKTESAFPLKDFSQSFDCTFKVAGSYPSDFVSMLITCRSLIVSGCNRQYRTMEAMDQHCAASHGIWRCTKGCSRQYWSLSARNDHERDKHLSQQAPTSSKPAVSQAPDSTRQVKSFRCRIDNCLKAFPTSARRDHHEEVKHGVPRVQSPKIKVPAEARKKVAGCNECMQEFVSYEALRQHQHSTSGHTRLASALGSSGCGHCKRTLRSQDALEQHFASAHPLILIEKEHGAGAELVRSFVQSWRKQTTSIPNTLFVYQIYNKGWRITRFNNYKGLLPHQGNVKTRYHGTTLRCELGAGVSKLCPDPTCGLCGIIRSGFKTAKAREGTFQRFGRGIYTTATSSKSNDYVRTSSPWTKRAVLVCEVATGNAFRTYRSMTDLKGPPEGYDSVSGEVGKDLNYDETVIYKSKAILPRYLLVYQL